MQPTTFQQMIAAINAFIAQYIYANGQGKITGPVLATVLTTCFGLMGMFFYTYYPSLSANNAYTGNNTHGGTETFTGATAVDNLYNTTITNELLIAPAFNLSICLITGCDKMGGVPYDSQRASIYSEAQTLYGPTKEEYHIAIETDVDTGYEPAWQASTVYAANSYVLNATLTYINTGACTSGSMAPTGTGTNISDGGCTWNYVASFGRNVKIGLYNGVNCNSGGGQCWGMTNNVGLHRAPYPGINLTGAEFDIGLQSGNCVIGTMNCVNVSLTGGTSGEITAELGIGQSSTTVGGYATHYGILFSNLSNFIQDATVDDNSSATVSYQDAGTHTSSVDTHFATVTYALKAAINQEISLNNGDANFSYVGANTTVYSQQGQIVAELQSTTSSSPNYLIFNNNASGNGPNIGVSGIDTNAAINVLPKGTGALHVVGGSGLVVDQNITGSALAGTGSRPLCATSAGKLEVGSLSAGLVTCPP